MSDCARRDRKTRPTVHTDRKICPTVHADKKTCLTVHTATGKHVRQCTPRQENIFYIARWQEENACLFTRHSPCPFWRGWTAAVDARDDRTTRMRIDRPRSLAACPGCPRPGWMTRETRRCPPRDRKSRCPWLGCGRVRRRRHLCRQVETASRATRAGGGCGD
jgi:hypothetical protein